MPGRGRFTNRNLLQRPEYRAIGSYEVGPLGASPKRSTQLLKITCNLTKAIGSDVIVGIFSDKEADLLNRYTVPDVPSSLESMVEEAKNIYEYRLRMEHSQFFGFSPWPVSPMVGEVLNSAYNNAC